MTPSNQPSEKYLKKIGVTRAEWDQLEEDTDTMNSFHGNTLAENYMHDLIGHFLAEIKQLKKSLRHVEREKKVLHDKIVAGTRLGLAKAKARGVKLGGHRKSKVDIKLARKLRKEGWTLADLGRKFDVTPARMSQILKPKRRAK